MLTLKYRPKKFKDIIGNNKAKEKIKEWAEGWQEGKKQKPILLYGPPGTGKTITAHVLANNLGWLIVEMNVSNKRSKDTIEGIVGEKSTMSLFGGYRLILIDDVDQLSGREDTGAISAIIDIIKNANNPVILTALDYWDQKISALRGLVQPVEFKKVNSRTVAKHLRTVSENEGIKISEKKIEEIVENVNGDVRAALNDLESMTTEPRNVRINIFEVMKIIFKKSDYNQIRETVFSSAVDHDLLSLWILENIPNEYEKQNDIANAFYYLSRADMFRGRIIRQQYWGYLRYVTDLMSCGVGLAKGEPYHKFVKYKFPHYLSLMSKTRSTRTRIKSICSKIGAKTHDSVRDVRQYLWLFSLMVKKELNKELTETYGVENEEIEFLKEYKG